MSNTIEKRSHETNVQLFAPLVVWELEQASIGCNTWESLLTTQFCTLDEAKKHFQSLDRIAKKGSVFRAVANKTRKGCIIIVNLE